MSKARIAHNRRYCRNVRVIDEALHVTPVSQSTLIQSRRSSGTTAMLESSVQFDLESPPIDVRASHYFSSKGGNACLRRHTFASRTNGPELRSLTPCRCLVSFFLLIEMIFACCEFRYSRTSSRVTDIAGGILRTRPPPARYAKTNASRLSRSVLILGSAWVVG